MQLHQQITWLIASGQLIPGDLLPSIRLVAAHLQINLHTVRSAYQKLEADGLVKTYPGLGTIVLPYDQYRMARIAGSLQSHTIGIIIPSLTNPFYHLLLQGVETVANHDHMMLFMCVTHDDPGVARRTYAQLAAKNVDGILLVSQDNRPFTQPEKIHGDTDRPALPLVAVDWPGSAGYSVTFDLENAGYAATMHLIEHGHNRIGLITYTIELPNISPINEGYRRALREAGLPYDKNLAVPVHGFDTNAGAEGACYLLSRGKVPTAIFAISDLLAIGAMCAVQQNGLRVPQDIAIAGFNDTPLAALANPALTTVAAPAYQMGMEAMKILASLVKGEQPPQQNITLPTTLVTRRSCGDHATPSPCQEGPEQIVHLNRSN